MHREFIPLVCNLHKYKITKISKFSHQQYFEKNKKNLAKKTDLKSSIFRAVVFFCSPDCPKQIRTEYPFHR